MKKVYQTFVYEILGFQKHNKKSINLTWSLLFAGIILIITFISFIFFWKWEQEKSNTQFYYQYMLALLVIVTHLIVAINTCIYLYTSSKIITKFRGGNQEKMIWFNILFFCFYVLSLCLSVFVIYKFIDGLISSIDPNWQKIYRLNEILSLLIFLIFLLIDFKLFETIKEVMQTNPDSSLHNDKSFVKKQISYIGFPGFVGILIIFIITTIYYSSGIFDPDLSNPNGNFIYGFSAGAIAMHILFTQIIFSVLKTNQK